MAIMKNRTGDDGGQFCTALMASDMVFVVEKSSSCLWFNVPFQHLIIESGQKVTPMMPNNDHSLQQHIQRLNQLGADDCINNSSMENKKRNKKRKWKCLMEKKQKGRNDGGKSDEGLHWLATL